MAQKRCCEFYTEIFMIFFNVYSATVILLCSGQNVYPTKRKLLIQLVQPQSESVDTAIVENDSINPVSNVAHGPL